MKVLSTRDSHHRKQFTIFFLFLSVLWIRIHWIRIRIQHFKWIRIQSGSKALMNKTWRLQEKPSTLKREHSALQKMKFSNFLYFCGSFLPSWIRIHNSNFYSRIRKWIRLQNIFRMITSTRSPNSRISQKIWISSRQGLQGTHGSEHIAGVRTQLTPFSLHPRSTSWNRSHFYSNLLLTNKVTAGF